MADLFALCCSDVCPGLPTGVEMHHLSFDGVYARVRAHLLSREEEREERALFDPQVWKLSRAVALQWAEAIVQRVRSAASQGHPSHAAHILLLDDNFPLRSMRRRAYQLARKHSTAFMQVHVSIEADRAVRRNDGRNRVVRGRDRAPPVEDLASQEDVAALDAIVTQLTLADARSEATQSPGGDVAAAAEEDDAVSEATIRNMAAAFQAPPSLKRLSNGAAAAAAAAGSRSCFPASVPHSEHSWERLSISVGPERFEHLDEVERAMAEALRLPLSPLADPAAEAQRVAEARAESEANMLHQLDLATRRVLNAQLAACPGDRKADCASRWNALRRQLLLDARKPGTAAFALCAALQDAASASAQDAASSSSASAAASPSSEDMPAVTLLVAYFKELLQD